MLSYRCHEVLPCFVFGMAHGIYCCIVQPNSNTVGIAVNPHFDGTIIDFMRILQALPLLSNGEPHSPGLLKSRDRLETIHVHQVDLSYSQLRRTGSRSPALSRQTATLSPYLWRQH